VKGQEVFTAVHKLNFPLLADEDGSVAKKFGVPISGGGTFKTKDADANEVVLKRGVTAKRCTFVIGLDGKIAHKDMNANAGNDSKTVAKVIEKLKKD
jgi:peroxiredoxin Q/BCP